MFRRWLVRVSGLEKGFILAVFMLGIQTQPPTEAKNHLRNTRLGTNPPQVTRPRRISAHEEPEIVVPERSRTVTRHTPEPKAFRNRCYSQA